LNLKISACPLSCLLWTGLAVATVPFVAEAQSTAMDTPPARSISLDADAAGSAELYNLAGAPLGRQSSAGADFSFLQRAPMGGAWYWGWGVKGEIYSFNGTNSLPLRHLQDVAGQFSLEYFSGSEVAAYLILRPGLYFGGHPGTDSWDIPIECATGIPLTAGLEGALGVSDGRLWRGPVPVIGLVWDIATGIRLDAVYPEPDLVVALGKNQELRLAGDLSGNGFEVGPASQRTRLEYYSYRVGLTYTRKLAGGLKLSATAGFELERVFDFYRNSRRLEAERAPYAQLGLEF
jgi:hypothetical protein